jgi:hypothetical protein
MLILVLNVLTYNEAKLTNQFHKLFQSDSYFLTIFINENIIENFLNIINVNTQNIDWIIYFVMKNIKLNNI